MAFTLTSTLQDILDAFVLLGPDHDPAQAEISAGKTMLSIRWLDTSRVDLRLSVLSVGHDGVRLNVPPGPDVEGGENPNNPPPDPIQPLAPDRTLPEGEPLNRIREGVPLLV